jgi:protease-4
VLTAGHSGLIHKQQSILKGTLKMTHDQNSTPGHGGTRPMAEGSRQEQEFGSTQHQPAQTSPPPSYATGQTGQGVYPPPGYQYSSGPYGGGMPPGPPPRYTGGEPGRKRFPIWRVLFGLIAVAGVILFIVMLVIPFLRQGGAATSIAFGSRIGLVHIEGLLTPGIQHDFQMKALHDLAGNNKIKGIVLYIDSPGGPVGSSQELYEKVRKIRTDHGIPIYTAMGNTAASGGYYIAAASDRIYALKGSLTGSIGVIFSKPEISELAKRVGVGTETIASGRFKDAGALTRKMSENERYIFEYMINDTHQQFMDDILTCRQQRLETAALNLPDEKWGEYLFDKPEVITGESFLAQVADGRAYTGRQALELGLIDDIGALDDAIKDMAEEVGITGNPDIIHIRYKPSFSDLLGARMDSILGRHAMLEYIMPSY